MNVTTAGGVELPGDLADDLNKLLGLLSDWLATASDAVHADLDHFARTEYDYSDVWTLLEELGRHSLALHRLTDLRQTAAANMPIRARINSTYQQKEQP